jgi:hypothetical protein
VTINPGDAQVDALFDYEVPPSAVLADRFGVPPQTVWDRRMGDWQRRKRRWLSLGIKSELGREAGLTFNAGGDFMKQEMERYGGTTSTFDPVVAELAYRWWSNPGDHILDPFAGGSVRGIVAGVLGRYYTGIDLRTEQVLANRVQGNDIMTGKDAAFAPWWIVGDATQAVQAVTSSAGHPRQFDFCLSCPPYADLEVYSDNPYDLSNMAYHDFTKAHQQAIGHVAAMLRDDRFAVWVISDARDTTRADGAYYGLVGDTERAFRAAGMRLYNDIILVDPLGTGRLRAGNLLNKTRKVVRMHQHVMVFVKGDGKRAARRLDTIDPVLLAAGPDDDDTEGSDDA